MSQPFKLSRSASGTRIELGNITTFLSNQERKELIAELLKQDIYLVENLTTLLHHKGYGHGTLAAVMIIVKYLTDMSPYYQDGSDPYPALRK